MNLVTSKIIIVGRRGFPFDVSLDHINKRVYWVAENDGIISSTYDGVNVTNVRKGSFNHLFLGIFGDLVYFQEMDVPYINEMNISSRNISRSFKVDHPYLIDKQEHRDLVVVHSSLQPIGELHKLYQYSCGLHVMSHI